MTDSADGWSPHRRDRELRRIDALSTAIIVGSVGITVAFGAGIVWDDANTAAKADQGTADTTDTAATPTPSPSVTPPGSKPAATPAAKSPKSKSGGS